MKNKSQSIIIITAILLAHAASATEFNINAIDKDLRSGIDLSRFKEETSVTPGRYFVTVAINDIPLANGWELTWKEVDNKAEVCIPAELADTFGLQDTIRKTLTLKQGCVDFTSQADIKFRFEQSTQTLHVTVPQAMMQFRPNDWMPPSTWDNGVAGVLLDYTSLPAIISHRKVAARITRTPTVPQVPTWVHGVYVAIISTIKRMPREGQPITAASHASICSVLCRRLARN